MALVFLGVRTLRGRAVHPFLLSVLAVLNHLVLSAQPAYLTYVARIVGLHYKLFARMRNAMYEDGPGKHT